jgi:hypothetical protein
LGYGLVLAGFSLFVAMLGHVKPQPPLVQSDTSPRPQQPPALIEVQRHNETSQGRTMALRISAADGTRCLDLRQFTGPRLTTLTVNDKPVFPLVRFSPEIDEWGFRLLTGDRSPVGYRFAYCGLGQEPISLLLQVHGPGSVGIEVTQDVDTQQPSNRWVPTTMPQHILL